MTEPAPNPDNLIDALLEGASPAAAATALAGLVNRASARLHSLARGQANAYKGQPEWPAWAQVQNAARALVLQASTCRDLTARLPTTAASASSPAPNPSADPEAATPAELAPAPRPQPAVPEAPPPWHDAQPVTRDDAPASLPGEPQGPPQP